MADNVARGLAMQALDRIPKTTSADAGKLATVDSNGEWTAAELEVGQGEVAVDTTLLVSGAAADAKVTGDKVNELKSAVEVFYEDADNIVSPSQDFDNSVVFSQYGSYNMRWFDDVLTDDCTISKVKIRAYKYTNSEYKFKIVGIEYDGTSVYIREVSEEITLEEPSGTYEDYTITLNTPFTIAAGHKIGIAASDGYWFRYSTTGTQSFALRSETYSGITADKRIMTYLPSVTTGGVSVAFYSTSKAPKDFITENEVGEIISDSMSKLMDDQINQKTLWESGGLSNDSAGSEVANTHYVRTDGYISSDVDVITNNDPTNVAMYVHVYDQSDGHIGALYKWQCLKYDDVQPYESATLDLIQARYILGDVKFRLVLAKIPEADILVDAYWNKVAFTKYRSISKADQNYIRTSKTLYIDPEGNDDNDGSVLRPVATVNRALMLGADKIMVNGGSYIQTINLANCRTSNVEIIGADPTERAVFYAPDCVIAETETQEDGYTNVYKATTDHTFPSTTSRIFLDGVDDESTEVTREDIHPLQRGNFYRCEDTKIYRCTSETLADALDEIENADVYKWFYDSGTIYFSRPQSVSSSHPLCTGLSTVRLFSNNNRAIGVKLSGLVFKYMGVNLDNLAEVEMTDCKVANGCGTGIQYNNALNVRLVRCEACNTYSGGLGDGIAATGISDYGVCKGTTITMIDCWSHDNNDDGFSDHVGCETTIIGGLYEYNGKGGVLPTGGGSCTCYNVTSRNNAIGFEIAGSGASTPVTSGRNGQQMECISCVAIGNSQYGFFSSGNKDLTLRLVSCKALNNAVGYSGPYGGETSYMVCIDCSGSGNTTEKSEPITVITTSALS